MHIFTINNENVFKIEQPFPLVRNPDLPRPRYHNVQIHRRKRSHLRHLISMPYGWPDVIKIFHCWFALDVAAVKDDFRRRARKNRQLFTSNNFRIGKNPPWQFNFGLFIYNGRKQRSRRLGQFFRCRVDEHLEVQFVFAANFAVVPGIGRFKPQQ